MITDSDKYLFEILDYEGFRTHIKMYMLSKKIHTLATYIEGARHGISKCIKEPDNFMKFHDWVADYYDLEHSSAGWPNIILKESGGDEEKAVDTFFQLYDEFKKEQITK
jgi:hypothetical protein